MGLHSERFEGYGQLAYMIGQETLEAKWQQSQAYCGAIWATKVQSNRLALAYKSLPKLATHPNRTVSESPL
jgi:hypothetical protein